MKNKIRVFTTNHYASGSSAAGVNVTAHGRVMSWQESDSSINVVSVTAVSEKEVWVVYNKGGE